MNSDEVAIDEVLIKYHIKMLEFTINYNESRTTEGVNESKSFVISDNLKFVWTLLFTSMILVAIIGNSFIIWIIVGHRKMRSVTNTFILNLSIADLVTTVFNVSFNFIFMLTGDWLFGPYFCKITNAIASLTLSASVFTIMALSIER